MPEVLLQIGVVFTVAHVVIDLTQFRRHWRHKRDWLTLLSAIALVGHVTLTGEWMVL